MKKGKVFGKSQIALAVMIIALAGAIWLNMSYSKDAKEAANDTPSKYLGQAEYANNEQSLEEADSPVSLYFNRLRSDRLNAREDAIATIADALENSDLSDSNKKNAVDRAAELASRIEKEAAIETLLRAKGFDSGIAVIGDEDINIIVHSDELLASETVQIQDAVLSQTDFPISKIKIIALTTAEIENALK